MKELTQIQTAQLGGEAQQNKTQWEVRFISYDYTADEEGERLWRHVGELPTPELILEIEEECDCGKNVLHNNGGHYHYWWRIYKLDDEHYLIYMNNTREAFTPWEQGFIYITSGEVEYSIWTETISECSAWVCKKEEALEEVRSILENYDAYISSGSLEALT
jgi:hypothetical protein